MKTLVIFLILQSALLNNTYTFAQAGEWIWLSGSNVLDGAGNFGVQGVSSPTNTPPSLYEACEWIDSDGNLWLFGGVSGMFSNEYGDLWKYDTQINEWTWMKGTSGMGDAGSYGVQGVPSPLNRPRS